MSKIDEIIEDLKSLGYGENEYPASLDFEAETNKLKQAILEELIKSLPKEKLTGRFLDRANYEAQDFNFALKEVEEILRKQFE